MHWFLRDKHLKHLSTRARTKLLTGPSTPPWWSSFITTGSSQHGHRMHFIYTHTHTHIEFLPAHLTLEHTFWYKTYWVHDSETSFNGVVFFSESCAPYHRHPRCNCCPQLLRCSPHSRFWLPKLKERKASHPLLWTRHHEVHEGDFCLVWSTCML